MAHPSTFTSAQLPTALLAVKRFMRGTLRQLGIGLVSLMLILGMSVDSPPGILANTALTNSAQPRASVLARATSNPLPANREAGHPSFDGASEPLSADSVTQVTRPSHMLRANMTHHHLTSARMSIPSSRLPMGKYEVATLGAPQ
ncbi:MAG: hypothetical protein AAFV90_26715 [Cyanobacteria bacterium J06634_5]